MTAVAVVLACTAIGIRRHWIENNLTSDLRCQLAMRQVNAGVRFGCGCAKCCRGTPCRKPEPWRQALLDALAQQTAPSGQEI